MNIRLECKYCSKLPVFRTPNGELVCEFHSTEDPPKISVPVPKRNHNIYHVEPSCIENLAFMKRYPLIEDHEKYPESFIGTVYE